MAKKVLIAVGNKSYSKILIDTFKSYPDSFSLSSQEVLHRRFLEEIIENEKPDILLIHDYYLESDYNRKELQEQELLSLIRTIRLKYEDSIRIIFLCERRKGDTLLSNLVSLGIWDIFNSNSFDLESFIEQLNDRPRFPRVEKFLIPPSSNQTNSIDLDEEEDINEEESNSEKAKKTDKKVTEKKVIEKKVVQKVVEKKVVQKVVNKTTIKRDYNIQVTNQTEKVIGIPVQKKLIMIGSPLPRSGSTFVSHLLAKKLADFGISTTYVESPFSKPYTYDRFFGHHHSDNYKSKFFQFSKDFNPKIERTYEWCHSDVNLICKHPTSEQVYQEDEINFENLIKVLFNTSSTVTIMDVGTDWRAELFQDAFDIADHVYLTFEPDIPFIQFFEENNDDSLVFLRRVLEDDKSSIIGNRYDNSFINNRVIKDVYADKLITTVPSFPVTDVFSAQYKGVFLNDLMKGNKTFIKSLDSLMQPLIEQILPIEFVKKTKSGQGLFKRIFNKKIRVDKTDTKGEEASV